MLVYSLLVELEMNEFDSLANNFSDYDELKPS